MTVHLFGELSSEEADVGRFGIKGGLLHWFAARGERVPAGFVVEVGALDTLRAGDTSALDAGLARLREGAPSKSALSVRASPTLRLPGALKTTLDVSWPVDQTRATPSVLTAIEQVVASAGEPVREHLTAHGLNAPEKPWLAVIVQVMVHADSDRAFGAVAHSRSPLSGEPGLVGEHVRGQGAHRVVGGRVRPKPLLRAHAPKRRPDDCLEAEAPEQVAEIAALVARLERGLRAPAEAELVFDGDALWLLEAREAVLSARAAARVALDDLRHGAEGATRSLERLWPRIARELVDARLPEPEQIGEHRIIARGLAASPGSATGTLLFSAEAIQAAEVAHSIVIVRRHAVPDDIALFRRAAALWTTSGGLTSHAAVIARGLGLPAVVGCHELEVDAEGAIRTQTMPAGAEPLARAGDEVTLDGHRGVVYRGAVEPEAVVGSPDLLALLAETEPRRACPLWVTGPAAAARRVARECVLTGSLQRWDPAAAPLGEGAWWLAREDEVDALLAQNDAAGICVVAEPDCDYAALATRLSGRKLGVLLSEGSAPPSEPLALLVAAPSDPHLHDVSAAMRLCLTDDFEAGRNAVDRGHFDGLLCAPQAAASWAIRLVLGSD